MSTTARRFYIDRSSERAEPIVRAVPVRRSPRPATHQAQNVSGVDSRRDHHVPPVGKLIQSAIRRRSH